MIFIGLSEQNLRALRNAYTRCRGQDFHILADQILLHMRPLTTLAVALERKRSLGQALDRRPVQLKAAGVMHGAHELPEDGSDHKHFLLPDAQQIIVEGAALDNRLCRYLKISRSEERRAG